VSPKGFNPFDRVPGLGYRTLMRLAHRFHWHHMKPYHPDGDTIIWCHWCGARYAIPKMRAAMTPPAQIADKR
jgi:hypothetical protein